MDTTTSINSIRQRHHKTSSSRSTSPVRTAPYHNHHNHHQPHLVSNTTTSRWQQLVVGAGSAAGTTAAVISEESMKCLKYCLSWLQYATQHIEQQMHLLKNYLVSLANNKSSNSLFVVPPQHQQQHQQQSVLSNIRKDIVETLRKVVEVITRYAGASLPIQARQTVRGFILNLPGKWAHLNDIRSTTTSPAASPMLGPMSSRSMSSSSLQSLDSTSTKQEEAAIQLLSFGQESVEMLNSVSTVFSDTVDRAELWIDRLKMVPGLNKGSNAVAVTVDLNDDDDEEEGDILINGESVRLPPIRSLNIISNNEQGQKFDHR